MESAIVRIKKGEARALKAGGMWIYDNEIDTITGDFTNEDIVTVEDFDGYFSAVVLSTPIPKSPSAS